MSKSNDSESHEEPANSEQEHCKEVVRCQPQSETTCGCPKVTTRLADIRIGCPSPQGRLITEVYWVTKDYAIFKAGGRISPMFSDDDGASVAQRKNYMQLGQALARINSLDPQRVVNRPHSHGFFKRLLTRIKSAFGSSQSAGKPTETTRSGGNLSETMPTESRDYFSREVARAIALCLDNLGDEAKAVLAFLEHKVLRLKQNEHRMIYLMACFGVMFFYSLIVGISTYQSAIDSFSTIQAPVLRATVFGAIAGFFSVSIGIRDIEFDLDARWFLTLAYGMTRIMIAVIAALFVYLALTSGIVFTSYNYTSASAGTQERAVLYVLAFLSGFSERFVPNVLAKFESTATDGDQKLSDPKN